MRHLSSDDFVNSVSGCRETTADFLDSPSDEVHISRFLGMYIPEPFSTRVVRPNSLSLFCSPRCCLEKHLTQLRLPIEGENYEFL